jgi:hypothetical protein
VGYVVTSQNGTKDAYPLDSCPVPVTPAVYAVAVRIESDPRFVAAENGSQFAYDPTDQVVKSNASGSFQTFSFALYSDQKFYSCGVGSEWTYYQLGEIVVTVPQPVNPSGALQLQIHAIPKAELNMPSCGEISFS